MNQQPMKKIFSLLLIFTLLFSNFSTVFANDTSVAEDTISVSEAIANNTGSATVEGYIVGTMTNDTEPPFSANTNLILADSVDETDSSKFLPVQLPKGSIRDGLNLVDNPGNYHAKIQITGDLAAYFSKPGLKSPTSYTVVEGGEAPEPPPELELKSINEVRSLTTGSEVIIQGVVTADNEAIGGGKLSTYIQDETAGINVYNGSLTGFPSLVEGQKIEVVGKLAEYNGLLEVIPNSDGIKIIEESVSVPTAKAITIAELQNGAVAEPLEGSLVKVKGYVQTIPSSPAGGGYNVSFLDEEFNSITLRVMEDTNAIESLEEGKWYDITAVLSQYNTYQILPRKASDIVLSAEQPDAPSAAGEYIATVASVTDGDTIKLATPVLGANTVRYVNIDTPETYHSIKNAADQNQKDHGEAAKNYMNTLLKAGDEVIVKVGEEPTDAYGRILAQIIRKSDGLNTNLEMVKAGYATTYFIWPVGDEADYTLFQDAVKEAKDAERGIWNPEDELMELPFEFRAREQGKGLLRYVGNSETMKYVSPEDFEDVPVEARVFFSSNEEAEANGYLPVGDDSGEPQNPEEPSDNVSLQLLSSNDWHGMIDLTTEIDGVNYGRADYLAAYLREREATNPNTLIVHPGDMIGGSPLVSALYQDEPTVEIMNSIGYDIGTVGNHEFDEGTTELLRMINGGDHPEGKGTENYTGMDTKMLCANCVYRDSGETILDPYTIEEVDGVKVGFIGVNTPATATMVIPTGIKDIKFTDPVEAVDKAVVELKQQGVRAIVVLSHLPATQNGDSATGEAADLAMSVDDEVDIVYAAHNHVKVNAVVDNKLVVQAWDYGNAFSDIDVEIDRTTGDIVEMSAELVDVIQADIEPDPEVAAILKKYSDLVDEQKNEVVGKSAQTLVNSYPTRDKFGDPGVGNLLADSMKFSMDSDFALMNGGGVRNPLHEGEITWGDLFNITPFGNYLVKIEISGAEFKNILNAMISPQYGADSFIAGAKYTWDPLENEVVDVFLLDEEGKVGSEIDPTATYSLVVNNYMYENSEHSDYRLLSQYGKNKIDGKIDVEALVDYVKSYNNEPIVYPNEGLGRIEAIEVVTPDLGEVTIKEAREAGVKKKVTVEGIVTVTPGVWGSNGYYIQDDTAGVYVNGAGVKIGDRVKLTGITAESAGEFQLTNLIGQAEILGSVDVPAAIQLTPSEINEATEGKLVEVKGATISELKSVNTYGTFEFIATKEGKSVSVRVDNRAGVTYDNFAYKNGDVVNVKGVVGEFNGTYQLKPRMVEDIVVATDNGNDNGSGNGSTVITKPIISEKEAAVSSEDLAIVTENGTVSIDLTDHEDVETLNLTKEQLQTLKTKNADVSIVKDGVQLNIPTSIFNLGEDVAVEFKKGTRVNTISDVYDFTIYIGNDGSTLSTFSGIELVFEVDLKDVKNPENLKVFYLNEITGKWELVGGEYKDGKVTATTTHFSVFTVQEVITPGDGTDGGTDSGSGDGTDGGTDNGSEDGTDGGTDNSSENGKDIDSSDSEIEDVTKGDDGKKLPNTATATYNWLIVGTLILAFGLVVRAGSRKRKLI
ncbi:DUF6359 domain-containing protein [Bacillus suaedae]|uniref:5'-nucleotidase C-terminal domain-containing protein n=1 Tax=Halalkalibacter suaedae TaxID=2822140 RepID=A0A940WUM1_9BACI|nr:DUF6359 domain-containing protein [Bacillus suaedae]MBP3952591.1 5'-nucleotidase C-terminal domain-containing protein [Bacillus suaedae]